MAQLPEIPYDPDRLLDLQGEVIDVDYHPGRSRLAIVARDPDRLTILDPRTQRERTVELAQPTAVSFSADGRTVAVARETAVSTVDVGSLRARHYEIATGASEVALGEGSIYFVPGGRGSGEIQQLELASRRQTRMVSGSAPEGSRLAFHPEGDRVYLVYDNANVLARFDVGADGSFERRRSAPSRNYGVCGRFWLSNDHRRIISGCGDTFVSASDPMQDMFYRGALVESETLYSLCDNGDLMGAIPQIGVGPSRSGDFRVKVFDSRSRERLSTWSLPKIKDGERNSQVMGSFVFCDPERLVVLGEAQVFHEGGTRKRTVLLEAPWEDLESPPAEP